jgi:periplasmic protein CpxP/Spy
MKNGLRARVLFVLATSLLVTAASAGHARTADQEQQQPEAQQMPRDRDPIRELNLSPEQREKIRAIREQQKEERFTINQRLREANLALEGALDSHSPDEAVVEQRLRDVAAAQAAQMRMRVLSEVRIRRVLTSEQLDKLRTLRQNARSLRREGRLDIRDEGRRRENIERQRGLPDQRNGLGPRFQRRGDLQRKPRP